MSELGEILDLIDVEYWLDREGLDYKTTYGSSGTQLNIHECPECGDDRWKVYLNAETGAGNCFVCDTKFSKWSFIKAHLGKSGRAVFEHCKQVAQEVGWMPKRTKPIAVETQRAELILPQSYTLPVNGKHLSYLANRGIDIETAQYFNLRYSHSGFYRYYHNGREIKQDYSRRVIIPIYDMSGELVSFQGRDISGSAEKKYLFPPGYASTGKFLYNAHNVIGLKNIVVGEGVFDVMATKLAMDTDMQMRSIGQVGTFGKHLSHGGGNDQLGAFIQLKRHGLESVTMMWDGSDDAILAAVDAGMLLKGIGLSVRIATLPKNKDPNEVPPHVVRDCYRAAQCLSVSSAAKLKLSHG